MKIYKHILVCVLSVLLSACIGGIDSGGVSGSETELEAGGDLGSPTLEIFSGDSQVVLAWTPDPTNPGDSYQLNRDSVGIYNGTDTGYNDLGLTNGQRYCYTVSAITGENVATSAQACATPLAGTVLAITNQSLAADLSWTAVPGAISYNIYLDGAFSGPLPSLSKSVTKAVGDGEDVLIANVVGTSYAWTGLSNDCVTYPVKIVPVDIDGNESHTETTYEDVEPRTEGSLDVEAFGVDGIVQLAVDDRQFTDIGQLSDGTIIALFSRTFPAVNTPALVAFDEDGAELWDIQFDGALGVWLELDEAHALTVDDNDNIIVTGEFGETANTCRLIPVGGTYEFDAGFGIQGCTPILYPAPQVPASHATTQNQGYDVIVDSEGRIVVAGRADEDPTVGNRRLAVWRLLGSNGFPDTSFATNGQYLYDDISGTGDRGTGIVEADDGSYFISSRFGEQQHVVKIDPFDVDTVGHWPIGTSFSSGPEIMDDGNILVVGGGTADPIGFIYMMFTDVPAPDTFVLDDIDAGKSEQALDIERDCDGNYLLGGSDDSAPNGDALVSRADPTLARDATFAAGGVYLYEEPGNQSWINAIHVDDMGRILAAGYLEVGGNPRPTIWRIK